MKNIIFLCLFISTSAFGGSFGGTGLGSVAEDGTIETIVESRDIRLNRRNNPVLEKEAFSKLLADSLTRKTIHFNGENLTADKYDFESGILLLRSVSNPDRLITIESSSAKELMKVESSSAKELIYTSPE